MIFIKAHITGVLFPVPAIFRGIYYVGKLVVTAGKIPEH